jgi:hypothetical protein
MRTHWFICTLVLVSLLSAVAAAAAEEAQGPPAVEVHGWILTRYYADATVNATQDSSGVITNEVEDSWLEWERMSLYSTARLANGKEAYAEVYIHPWLPNSDPSFLYLESLYLDVPAGDGAKYRIGKGRSNAFGIVPGYGARKTSNYSPLSETFTMDRVLGIQYMQNSGDNSFAFGIFNSQRPGMRLIGMAADAQMDAGSVPQTTVMHLTDRDNPAKRSGELEASARYGRQMGNLNVGISGRGGALDNTDAAFLAKFYPTYNGTNQTRTKYGVDATYKRMPFYATFEYYAGDVGGIGQDGYAILIGVEPSKQCTGIWREMSGACKGLFVRYLNLDMDVPPVVNNTMTWDIEQLAISYVLPINTTLLGGYPKWLQFEYERNEETAPAGASEIPNDLFFVELFTAF